MSDIIETAKFVRMLADSDFTTLEAEMSNEDRRRFDETCAILRLYHREKTMNSGTEWTDRLARLGIDEDTGKAAIASARRLGMDIH